MSVDCPSCGSDETEWVEIVGNHKSPQGSIYECLECGREFDTRQISRDKRREHLRGELEEIPLCGREGCENDALEPYGDCRECLNSEQTGEGRP